MNPFRVWIRSLGNASRVRVEGNLNAQWLISRLSKSFVFTSSERVQEEMGTSCCIFKVPYSAQASRSKLESLLAAIPEVNLMREPA